MSQSACSEACPTNAIMFGDLNDTESATRASMLDSVATTSLRK